MKTPIKIVTVAVLCVLVLLGIVSCATSSGQRTIELFNGKDLKGWQYVLADPQVKMEQVWSVHDGILLCQGTPVGAIYRGPDVTNFRLVVEYRWPGKPSNSGVFSRISQPIKALPIAVETQLKNGSAGDVLGLQGKKVASGQPRFFEVKAHPLAGDISGVAKLADREKPAGEWNRIEILATGANYKVWMNSDLVNEVTGVEVNSGPVGVQSEGGPVEFRRISLTPL